MKWLILTLFIPFALFGSNSLRLEWRSVPEEQNGLKLLAEVHEEASLLESADFYDIIDAYKEKNKWNEREVADLLENSFPIEKRVREALKCQLWQVDGFYTPDTSAPELDAFHIWTAALKVRFQACLISNSPEEAYINCRDLSYSGHMMMGAKGGTLHFLVGLSAYSRGLELLSELKSSYTNIDFVDFRISISDLKELYRDAIRHEYGSALNLVDYLVKQLEDEGHKSERALIQVEATKELITEAYQEALDNTFREPSEYEIEKRERIEKLIEERLSPANAKNAAGLKLLTLLNWHPEEIWAHVIKRSAIDV
jgi:hypothetical protein